MKYYCICNTANIKLLCVILLCRKYISGGEQTAVRSPPAYCTAAYRG